MKPIRLLSSSESQQLEHKMRKAIQKWCDLFARFNVDCQFLTNCDDALPFAYYNQHNEPVLLCSASWSSFWSDVLFASMDAEMAHSRDFLIGQFIFSCFAEAKHFGSIDNAPLNSWHYRGAPRWVVRFSSEQQHTSMVVHPALIIHYLGKKNQSHAPLTKVIDALKEQAVSFEVAFPLGKLNLKDIRQLQVGDVLVSDHLVNQPVYLQKVGTKRAEVSLGQQEGQQSIQIRSFL